MNIIDSINQFMIELIDTLGYIGIFFAMLIEGIFTPIPSELIMPFAGYLSAVGELNAVAVVLVGSAGATVGSSVAYFIGKRVGRPLVARYGRYLFFTEDDLDRADRWFRRWGSYGILIGHSIPVVRSVISIPAGICRMDILRFVVFTFIGASIWNTVLVAAGYLLGAYWISFWQQTNGLDIVVLAILAAVFIAYIVVKWHRARAAASERAGEGG